MRQAGDTETEGMEHGTTKRMVGADAGGWSVEAMIGAAGRRLHGPVHAAAPVPDHMPATQAAVGEGTGHS